MFEHFFKQVFNLKFYPTFDVKNTCFKNERFNLSEKQKVLNWNYDRWTYYKVNDKIQEMHNSNVHTCY